MKRLHVQMFPNSSSSPAMAPKGDGAYPGMVSDKRYALHGEILMIVLILSFSIFLVLLISLPWLRRRRRRIREARGEVEEEDDNDGGSGSGGGIGNAESNIDSEIRRKFPFVK